MPIQKSVNVVLAVPVQKAKRLELSRILSSLIFVLLLKALPILSLLKVGDYVVQYILILFGYFAPFSA